jgi:hypothetical protein
MERLLACSPQQQQWNVPLHAAGAASVRGSYACAVNKICRRNDMRLAAPSWAAAARPGTCVFLLLAAGWLQGWVLGQPRRCALALPPPAAATPHGWRRRPAARCNSPGGGRRPRCFATGYIWAARRDCGVCKTRGLSAHGPWKPARRREASVPPAPATAPRLTSRRRGVASLCCCETRRLTLLQRAARVAGGRTQRDTNARGRRIGRSLAVCLFASATARLRRAQCLGAVTLAVGLAEGRGDGEALACPSGGARIASSAMPS